MRSPAVEPVRRFLGSIEPFRSLAPRELESLAADAKTESFLKGEALYNEGEEADGVWVLYEGRVQIFKSVSRGRSFALESLAPGELLGTLCRLGSGGGTYPCAAVASEPVAAIRIQERAFLDCCGRNPRFMRGLCSLCSERLRDVQGLRGMDQEPVPVRAAATLLRLQRTHGPALPFTKKEISELIAAALETTFRALSDMERAGIVSFSRDTIRIRKPGALRGVVERA